MQFNNIPFTRAEKKKKKEAELDQKAAEEN